VRNQIEDALVLDAILPGSSPKKSMRRKTGASGAAPLTLKGLTPGVSIHLSSCCHPIPGDRIVALRTVGHGYDVHTIDCPTLESVSDQPERWVDVAWLPDGESPDVFPSALQVVAQNEPGSLATVTGIVARNEANISNIRLVHRDEHFHTFVIDVEVSDLAHLTNIVAALRATKSVSSVDRIRD
jgi:GTP diphosphokinase / guanosine-3',5'-bis(diphosphate) 3'-diphosphatase